MRLIHCETYQGAIAAAHIEFPSRELYGTSEMKPDSGVISPVVIDQIGEVSFLPAVSDVSEAIAAAKAQIEHRNRTYVDHITMDEVSTTNAMQHLEDCGIPSELIPTSTTDYPYYPPCPSSDLHGILSRAVSEAVNLKKTAG
ncbi:MAG: hypothetical protein F6K42_08875 [Leptolyngbya sp. SIO1D8]|nr:hypothetical protein [Leptolyngbya sp. SIO1D8]